MNYATSVTRTGGLFLALLWAGLTGGLGVGCQSAKQPGSMSHASVQIEDKSPAEIRPVIEAVFKEEGYALTANPTGMWVFDRPGSRRDALKWGGFATGEGVVMRIKVKVTRLNDSTLLLTADSYAVQDAGDSFFETESRNVTLNHRPFQKMLDEVKRRLGGV